jgi:hypothetical protein
MVYSDIRDFVQRRVGSLRGLVNNSPFAAPTSNGFLTLHIGLGWPRIHLLPVSASTDGLTSTWILREHTIPFFMNRNWIDP